MEEKRKDGWTPPAATTSGEIHSSGAPVNSRRRGGGQKRKLSSLNGGDFSTPPSAPSKRQAREKQEAVSYPPIHNYPVTRARLQPSNSASAAAAASPSEVRIEDSGVARRDSDRIEEVKGEQESNETPKVDLEDLEANIETAIEAIRTRDAHVHVIPNHAGWFSWDKVHPLEEKTLPSFFDGKHENRTPGMYLEIRNWIMKKFHANPSIPIELSDLTEIEVGGMEARQVVMEFLDYWGLINYHPFPKIDTTIADDAGKADETENADSLLKSLFHFESEDSCMPVILRNSVSKPAAPSGLFPESAITEELVKSEGPSVEYHCNSCSADCSRKRYHCQKQADFDLCPDCFNNGMLGSDMSPSDFIVMEPAESGGASSGKWTDQETLLLLEALELFSENWNEIAEHVATKTKAQCILHFVQMPIEDVFFDNRNETENTSKEHVDNHIIDEKPVSKAPTEVTGETNNLDDKSLEKSKPREVGDSHSSDENQNLVIKALNEAFEDVGLLSLSSGNLSFADAANPVMTLAAFFVKLVDPHIATVSVRNSLKLLSSGSSGEQLALRNCFCLEDPPNEKKSIVSERIDIEMVEKETIKDEDKNIKNQKSDMDADSLRASSNDENKDLARKEDKPVPSTSPVNVEVLQSSDTNVCKMPDNANDPSEKGSVISANKLTMEVEVPPGFEREPISSVILVKPTDVPSSSLKNKDLIPGATSNSTGENGADKGEPEAENGKGETKEDGESRINKIRNAAVGTVSALSVKAKLLANDEEEQIRQLAVHLIDKQLIKLEIKLSFLNEMDNLVNRIREQLERSKLKLFHERAQIISARMSGSGSRPMSIANRSAIGLGGGGNSAPPRPPPSFIGMSGGQRPPLVSRPNIMMSNPPSNNHHHHHQDQQVSSVRSK